MPIRVVLVAGEASGDILGSALIDALKRRNASIESVGIPGPLMEAAGCRPLYPMEDISAHGIVEVLGKLPRILSVRKKLKQYCLQNPPDLFIGIDAPDFNLDVEKTLRQKGIKTLHYVSPTIWAWRSGRVKTIAKAVDHILTLLPFETKIYQDNEVAATFVGHPLADTFSLEPEKGQLKQKLGLTEENKLVAILPGSRSGEIQYLADCFLKTAECCLRQDPNLHFVVPMVNERRRQEFEKHLTCQQMCLPIHILTGQSQEAMRSADAILLASGTATLEAMLLKKPMTVAYRLHPLTHWLLKRMVKVNHVALPNLLANKPLVNEFLQDEATPEALAKDILGWLSNPEKSHALIKDFNAIHQQLKQNASEKAADVALSLIG